jgi:hypothetical protein
MRTTLKILGATWMLLCLYFAASLSHGIFYLQSFQSFWHSQPFWFGLDVFFISLNLAGAVAGFLLMTGKTWTRIILGTVTLFIVIASLLGVFAWFNYRTFSLVGILFDIFCVASALILFDKRKTVQPESKLC